MIQILKIIRRRSIQAVPVVAGILVLNFLLLHLAPGDVVDVIAGESGAATEEFVTELRQRYGLDRPLPVQLGHYLWNAIQLDLGFSHRHGRPVLDLILERLPATLILMGSSTVLALFAGIVLGVTASRYVRKLPDNLISILSLISYATPSFWVGLMFILIFSVKLGWLPSGGMESISDSNRGFTRVLDIAEHLVLPCATLALFYMAIYTRLMRSSMLEAYGQDYVRTALAKGLSGHRIAFKHVLRNAILPVITMAGIQLGSLFGGSVLIETVFSWPGLGRLAYDAMFQRDFNLLLGILLMSSVLVVFINMIIDILYVLLDPRIELK